jgi:hypothetical protein
MFFQTPRKAAAALLVAVALLCAAPSQAAPYHQLRRTSEEPARAEPGRSLTAFLIHLLDFLGGALDPNGQH